MNFLLRGKVIYDKVFVKFVYYFPMEICVLVYL